VLEIKSIWVDGWKKFLMVVWFNGSMVVWFNGRLKIQFTSL
jgi:hypothetical protein